MKENYFAENIDDVVADTFKYIGQQIHIKNIEKDLFKSNLDEYDLDKSALIVTDMQDFFLSPNSHAYIPASEAIITNINKLIDFFHKNNLPVIFTKHINTDENADMMGKWWKDVIKAENPLSKLTNKINYNKGWVLEKTQYDAFYNTNLSDLLDKHKVKNIFVTGVMTNLCCETTARSAFVKGYSPCIVADATAAYNLELYKASLLNLAHGFATLVRTDDLIKPPPAPSLEKVGGKKKSPPYFHSVGRI